MNRITRKLEFDAGHRVMNHESKCATLHGHRYTIYIEASSPDLDSLGRVIDFSVLKKEIGGWVDLHWDHNMILFKDDVETVELLSKAPRKKDPYLLPLNPTAENMGKYLLEKCRNELFPFNNTWGISIDKLTIWETPNCYAEVRREDL